jgi:isocitrate dehydrogenase
VATVLAGAWMLGYLGQKAQSEAIFNATKKVIAEKKTLTYDLGGNAKSSEMVDAIIVNLDTPLPNK